MKKFQNDDSIINNCRWIAISYKNVLNFNKLIVKMDVRRADIKGSNDKNTNTKYRIFYTKS